MIMVAGPYSAPTDAERRRNLQRINQAAARVLERGHIPIEGVEMEKESFRARGLPVFTSIEQIPPLQ